jgi:IS30 family transposase
MKRKQSFKHLDQFDRDRIEALLAAGHRQTEIASILQVNRGTISREINRRKRKDGVYDSDTAQHKAYVKRLYSKYQGMKVEDYPDIRKQIIEGLLARRSPDEIAGRMKRERQLPRIGANAIYKWLYSRYGQRYCHLLCTRRYKKRKQKKKTKREMISDRISLVLRPIGGIHAEGDLFVSSRSSGTQRSGAMIAIPIAKLLVGMMIENKKPAVMAQAMRTMKEKIIVDDITMDNGIENRNHKDFGLSTYFCDPHSPWQKPHVENGIGLLRRWFIRKKTDLRTVSEDNLQQYLHILNGKYRKSLGYRSAYEVAIERGIIQTKIPLAGMRIINEKVAFH